MATPRSDLSPARSRPPRRFLLRWAVLVTVGEVIAFAVPLTVLAAVTRSEPPQAVVALLAVGGGAGEGAVLGWFQARAIATALPAVSAPSWVRATAAGAAVGWAAGMAPSTLRPVLEGGEVFLLGLVMLAVIVVVLTSVGVAQWFVLRDVVDRAGTWIWASAAAWAAGLLLASPVWSAWSEGQSVALRIVIGVAGGLVMAVTMAVVTGFAMRAIVRRGPPVPAL